MRAPDVRGSGRLPAVAAVFIVGAMVGAVSAVEVIPPEKAVTTTMSTVDDLGSDTGQPVGDGTGPATAASAAPGVATTTAGQPKAGTAAGATVVPPSRFECKPGNNGGATDRGVTATEIELATTVVQSGIGSSFLAEMRFGMDAVISKVNREGGVCGRRLKITYKDDGWDAQRGAQYLRNFIQQGVFAIPVGASSEGLQVVIESGDLDRAKLPVVGTDGLTIEQYARPDGAAQTWVWPIATATVSSARIMAKEAYARGARKFGIVFDNNYRFGKEAAAAFDGEVQRLTGDHVDGFNKENTCNKRYCGIQAGQNSYSSQSAIFNGSQPDFVALFLEPQTALTWMQDPNTPEATSTAVKYGYGAAQPLFTHQFESQCGGKCDQMVVWTGFKPYIESYINDPAVATYVDALKAVNPQADEYNQFTQGAYIGMEFLVSALRTVGPELTRARLQTVMNAMQFKTGLTLQSTLPFRPDSRFANVTMQAFTMQFKGTPGGWRAGQVLRDPNPNVGNG